MTWTVQFEEDFEREFDLLPAEVQDSLYAKATFLGRVWARIGTTACGYFARI
jgi:hypothetical protein